MHLYESAESIPTELLTTSTVTITDLSHTPAQFMFPLINGRQSLIIGIVRGSRSLYSIFASFDHRVSEGLNITEFLSELKERVESHFYDFFDSIDLRCDGCEKNISEEISLGNRGFINMTLPDGSEGKFCRNCYSGC